MKRIAMTLAVLMLGSAASAQSGLGPVLQALERKGYLAIEVQREQNRIRIEARNEERERVLVYDAKTGALLSDTAEQERLRDRDRTPDDGLPDQDRDRDQIQDPDRDQTQDQDRLDSPDQDQTRDRDRDQIN